MAHLRLPFDTVKQVVKQAGIDGLWHQHMNGRWTLAAKGGGGLEWSPTRSKLTFSGDAVIREQLRTRVEHELKQHLIADSEHNSKSGLERITTGRDLLDWLIRYMLSSKQYDYPEPLVDFAEEIVRELSVMDEDGILDQFKGWSPLPRLGRNLTAMKHPCETRPYSGMLMTLAGRLHDELIVDYVSMWEAVELALEASHLADLIREKHKGDDRYLASCRTFEDQFGVRVRVLLDEDDK